MENDPYELNNLVEEYKYKNALLRMRNAADSIMIITKDIGFYPEFELTSIGENNNPFDSLRLCTNYNIPKLLNVLKIVNNSKEKKFEKLKLFIGDNNFVIRYWGAIGCLALGKEAAPLINNLKPLLNDKSKSVQIIAAEVLFKLGLKNLAAKVLINGLESKSKEIRLLSANSIDRLGRNTVQFKTYLIKKKNNTNKNVLKIVNWTIKNLGE